MLLDTRKTWILKQNTKSGVCKFEFVQQGLSDDDETVKRVKVR
jgi:hypothetical protein